MKIDIIFGKLLSLTREMTKITVMGWVAVSDKE
jgi:hypothetical protein